ncbi:hypothetical protein [Nocardia sp. NPDC050710]|uniref:hypothetical protein n=1 Tax=Nocardia sp. NPDC050710 TaxID=3157220 RepID=UPI00340E31B5
MTAHNPVQLVRHAAIVLAGAASLSLTVAAGTYIVNQMADTQGFGSVAGPAAPNAAPVFEPAPRTGLRATETAFTGEAIQLSAFSTRSIDLATDIKPVGPQSDPAVAPSLSSGVGGRLGLGAAYVGAQLASIRTNTVAFTVDTNMLSALSNLLLSDAVRNGLGVHVDPSGITRVRTEIDTHRGEVTLVFSDPALGEHSLRLDRNPAPSPALRPGAEGVVGYGSAGAPDTTATPHDSVASHHSAGNAPEPTVAI